MALSFDETVTYLFITFALFFSQAYLTSRKAVSLFLYIDCLVTKQCFRFVACVLRCLLLIIPDLNIGLIHFSFYSSSLLLDSFHLGTFSNFVQLLNPFLFDYQLMKK